MRRSGVASGSRRPLSSSESVNWRKGARFGATPPRSTPRRSTSDSWRSCWCARTSRAARTEAALVALPEVQEVHHVAGEDCFMLKVRVRDTTALNDLLAERIGGLEGVRSTKTTIVLRTAKETSKIPIAGADAGRSSEAGDDNR